jgi:hypothetical protein
MLAAKISVTPSAVNAIGWGPPVPPAFITRAFNGRSRIGIAALTDARSATFMIATSKIDLPVILVRSLWAACALAGFRHAK